MVNRNFCKEHVANRTERHWCNSKTETLFPGFFLSDLDYLTRQVIAKQEKQIYLEEKLAETNRDLEIAERKVKDLQLRLKRFVKDDEAKDKKMRQMEKEYKDLAHHMQQIEDSLESKSKNNNEGEPPSVKIEQQQKKNSSKMCVIL